MTKMIVKDLRYDGLISFNVVKTHDTNVIHCNEKDDGKWYPSLLNKNSQVCNDNKVIKTIRQML